MAFQILNPHKGMPSQIKGVLFDMDGVILDTEKLYCRFWREACQFYGFPMTKEQSLAMRSLNHTAAQQILIDFFGMEASYPLIHAKRIELMNAFVEKNGVEAKSGIYELLDYLEANHIPAAVTTASPIDRVTGHLGPLGLLHRFSRICTAAEVACGKPAPDIYLYGAKCLGLPPENCLALEDSATGMLSAHRAGCKNVIVPDLDQPSEATKAIAYGIADSLADVIALLESR